MTDYTKIELSKLELELMKNPEWILTKHSVMDKISALFSAQIPGISGTFSGSGQLPDELLSSHPKISKGERYQNLPYIIMDYPSLFSKDNIFAVRTMFLWGNFISITLQLSGKYKENYQQKITDRLNFDMENLFLCVSGDQWQHHFAEENYLPVNRLNKVEADKIISMQSFIKIAFCYQLEGTDEMEKNIKKACHYLAGLL